MIPSFLDVSYILLHGNQLTSPIEGMSSISKTKDSMELWMMRNDKNDKLGNEEHLRLVHNFSV